MNGVGVEANGHGDLPDVDAIPSHPLGVKPSGNGLLATQNLRPAMGAFAFLPDEMIVLLLETFDASCLKSLGATCKALYAFTRIEDLWKALFIEYDCSPYSTLYLYINIYVYTF